MSSSSTERQASSVTRLTFLSLAHLTERLVCVCVCVACLTHIIIVSCSVQTADIWHLNYAVSLLVGSLHWQYDAVLDYGRASVMGLTA